MDEKCKQLTCKYSLTLFLLFGNNMEVYFNMCKYLSNCGNI